MSGPSASRGELHAGAICAWPPIEGSKVRSVLDGQTQLVTPSQYDRVTGRPVDVRRRTVRLPGSVSTLETWWLHHSTRAQNDGMGSLNVAALLIHDRMR
jgi:hypothetical protein